MEIASFLLPTSYSFTRYLKESIMSISNRHPVNPFIAGKSAPMSDQRLAKVGYKNSKNSPARFPSICASVPYITEFTEDQFERLQPYIVNLLENAQDGILKSLY